MAATRKRFRFDSSFPFDLVYKDTKSSQRELPDHLHDWHELVYVYRGKGTFFIDRNFHDMQAGDLFAIPGNTIHRAFPDPADPVTSTAVFFSPLLAQGPPLGESFSYLRCFEHTRSSRFYKYALSGSGRRQAEDMLARMKEEMDGRRTGSRQAVVLELLRLLLFLQREGRLDEGAVPLGTPAGPVWMRDILAYIDEHADRPVRLAALAAQANVTPAHFSRVFKQLTGMSCTEYVSAKRIIRAAELLLESDSNVAEVAERCGFESMPHFHRQFKKYAGTTPAAYKRTRSLWRGRRNG